MSVSSTEQVDVAVVGASVAGCTVARLFAQNGASVALIERRTDPAAYKVVCTHAILPPSTRVMQRLGLAPLLLERGALRTDLESWTPYGGWLRFPDDSLKGWGVTRRTLDPLLRGLAVGTPGVKFFPGWTARAVTTEGGRPVGVEAEDPKHRRMDVRARLVVAADGRDSAIARLARVPGRMRPHNRFFYFAYWSGIEQAKPASRVWLLDPDGAAHFPNEEDRTLLVASYHRSRLAEVRADLEGSYTRTVTTLPDGPDLSGAERTSKLLGKLEVPNVMRPAAIPGLAFVGDAALATDPLLGVGLTFAFQSAEWLVDETSSALGSGTDLDKALRRYRRKFAWRLGPHHFQIADYATGRKLRPNERLTMRKASTDPVLAQALGDVLTRERSPFILFDPRITARLLLPQRPTSEEPE